MSEEQKDRLPEAEQPPKPEEQKPEGGKPEEKKPEPEKKPEDAKKAIPEKPARPKECSVCGKSIKNLWYYREGKYFCGKGCWDKLKKEVKKKKAEEAKKK